MHACMHTSIQRLFACMHTMIWYPEIVLKDFNFEVIGKSSRPNCAEH